nr:MAG TPA: hypothetical protein [Caudoviricetes sp.]
MFHIQIKNFYIDIKQLFGKSEQLLFVRLI